MKQNKIITKAVAVLLALLVWQALALIIKQQILLVGPIEVAQRLLTIWKEPGFFSSIWFSFHHIVLGLILGVILGVILGFLAGRFSLLETLLWPYMACVKSVPVASIVVICLIWLSANNLSIFISFLIVLPIIYQNTLSGYRNQSAKMRQLSSIFQIKGLKRLWYITLPQMKSHLLAGLSTACGIAWKAGVAAEVIGTPNGSIGQQIFLSKVFLDTDDLLAWTVVLVLISVLFEKLLIAIVKRLLP